jgi:hypothetical protein
MALMETGVMLEPVGIIAYAGLHNSRNKKKIKIIILEQINLIIA